MNKSESITELAKALAVFQKGVKQPLKDKANPFYKSKYVPLENVVEAITTTAGDHGLSFIQYPLNNGNQVGVITILMHSSGEWIESEPIFATPAKNDTQATGSVITYLKRYSLSAIFGITSDEDDDGNNGTYGNEQPEQQPYQKQQQFQNQSPSLSQYQTGITEPQTKALKAKLNNCSGGNQEQMQVIFVNALEILGFNPSLGTKDLSKAQASKVIDYLASIEPVKA